MADSFDTCCALNSYDIHNFEIENGPYYGTTPHTYHSSCRSQQRSIPDFAIDLVLDYGKCSPAGRGAESYSFDKRSWRKACDCLGSDVRRYERYRSIYVIVSDGRIVTVAWRH